MVSELLKSLDVSDAPEIALPAGKAEQAGKAEGLKAEAADKAHRGPEVELAAAQQPPDVLPGAKKPDEASTAGALCAG